MGLSYFVRGLNRYGRVVVYYSNRHLFGYKEKSRQELS